MILALRRLDPSGDIAVLLACSNNKFPRLSCGASPLGHAYQFQRNNDFDRIPVKVIDLEPWCIIRLRLFAGYHLALLVIDTALITRGDRHDILTSKCGRDFQIGESA